MKSVIYFLALLEALALGYVSTLAVNHPYTNDNMRQAYEYGCLLGQARGYDRNWPNDGYCYNYSKMFKEILEKDVETK